MDDDPETLLRRAFGESSDSDDDGSHSNPNWEPISEIKGLWLCRDFLSDHHQSSLLSVVQNEGWFTESSNNQAMRFGDLPPWAIELAGDIRELLYGDRVSESADGSSLLLPSSILWREPLFDQLIVNVYQPGEGISAHIDLMRFEDGIAIVSLESPCVMHFTPVGEICRNTNEENDSSTPLEEAKVPVYLTPGSLVLLSGEARYQWKHEINRKPGFQIWEGQELNQKKRTSITLRKLSSLE